MQIIENPNFRVSPGAVKDLSERTRKSPPIAPRPLVILAGYHSPSFPAQVAAKHLRRFGAFDKKQSLIVSYPFAISTQQAIETAGRAIQRRGWLGQDLDVIGISMGGLVARSLAASHGVRIARLYTLASPHLGANMSERIAPDPAAHDLMPRSDYLKKLDASFATSTYELVCYAVLRDWMVGATNTAPPGMNPHWLDPVTTAARMVAHFSISYDARIMADVALRIRGEHPLAGEASKPPRN